MVSASPQRFLLALTGIGIFFSKAVHIHEHLLVEPLNIQFIIFSPTLFISDVIIFLSIAYALYRPPIGKLFANRQFEQDNYNGNDFHRHYATLHPYKIVVAIFKSVLILLGIILPFVIYISTSLEVSFYWETGQLFIWTIARRVLQDLESFSGMLYEGAGTFCLVLILLFVLARVEKVITESILGLLSRCFDLKNKTYHSSNHNTVKKWIFSGVMLINAVLILSIFRPANKFDDLVTTVPLNILEAFRDSSKHAGGSSERFCGPRADQIGNGPLDFPYQDYIRWGQHNRKDELEWFVNWLPKPAPKGFERYSKKINEDWRKWSETAFQTKKLKFRLPADVDPSTPPTGYHQDYDPLKISNLHLDLHPELRAKNPQANDNADITTKPLKDIQIRHIFLVTMESIRSQVFPIRNGTRFAEDIYKTHDKDKVYDNFLNLTRTAQKLVGKVSGKGGAGGLVIEGGLTGSTYTLKSLLLSHCGVSPLSVDYLEEVTATTYQACLPNILKLLNTHKKNKENEKATDWKNAPWMTHFVQSVTSNFDRQAAELVMMGFNPDTDVVTKETMQMTGAKFPIPRTEKRLYYFGYREQLVAPYIKDLIQTAKRTNQRLFLSHLTTTTHHPWRTPSNHWKKLRFIDDNKRNSYLNSIGYGDEWLRQLMDIIESEEIAHETLVVFLGDHGLSIGEGGGGDSAHVTTFSNAHINNFRIPILFHHPELPPVHIAVNATNLSILPTILDMLLSSDSLTAGTVDKKIVSALLGSYEGQSLIRPMIHRSRGGLDNFNFGAVSPGSTHLAITSSDPAIPYRIIMPICQKIPYSVATLRTDSEEEDVLRQWTTDELYKDVEDRWGKRARNWVEKGIEVGRWWVREGRRRWNYN